MATLSNRGDKNDEYHPDSLAVRDAVFGFINSPNDSINWEPPPGNRDNSKAGSLCPVGYPSSSTPEPTRAPSARVGWRRRTYTGDRLNDQPLVSVIMTVYNGARWLHQSVPDVLGQDYSNLEFIVVDDGSTDDTLRVLAAYQDPRLRVVPRDHAGLVPSVNHAIEASRGRFLARMDVDDRCSRRRLSLQVARALAVPDIAVVGCSYQVLALDGRPLSTVVPPLDDEDLRRRLLLRNIFAAGSVLFDAERVRAIDGYDEAFTSAEDWALLVRLAAAGRLASVAEPLYGWRAHDSGMSMAMARTAAVTVERVMAKAWRSLPPAIPDRGAFVARADQYLALPAPLGSTMVAQLVVFEGLLAQAFLRRRRYRRALVQLLLLMSLPLRLWRAVLLDAPQRLYWARWHIRRVRR